MDFEFRFDDAYDFAQRMNAAPEIVGDELTAGIDRLTLQGEAFTKAETPVRSGHGRRSIAHKPATFGGGVATGSWGTSVPYMKWVEEGRGPVVARGRALRFEIGGTVFFRKRVGPAAGKHMFRKATQRIRPMVAREMSAVARRIVARMGGA